MVPRLTFSTAPCSLLKVRGFLLSGPEVLPRCTWPAVCLDRLACRGGVSSLLLLMLLLLVLFWLFSAAGTFFVSCLSWLSSSRRRGSCNQPSGAVDDGLLGLLPCVGNSRSWRVLCRRSTHRDFSFCWNCLQLPEFLEVLVEAPNITTNRMVPYSEYKV